MSILKPTIGAIAAVLACTGPAYSAVMVVFDHPATYSDQALRNGYGTASRNTILDDLQQHLTTLGNRYLGPNQRLDIEVLDIQLAGQFEPWHVQTRDVRVMRQSTWPMIKLRYRLQDGGRTLVSGEETVRDMDYLSRVQARMSTESLRYEKAMLDDWFRKRFAADKPR